MRMRNYEVVETLEPALRLMFYGYLEGKMLAAT